MDAEDVTELSLLAAAPSPGQEVDGIDYDQEPAVLVTGPDLPADDHDEPTDD